MLHQLTNSIGGENYNTHIYHPTIYWPPHFHQNPELALCLEGSCTLSVNGKSELLQAGDYALILSGQIHSYETLQQAKVWVGVFSPEFFGILPLLLRRRRPESFLFRPEAAQDELIRPLLLSKDASPLQLSAALALAADSYLQSVRFTPVKENDPAERIRAYVAEQFQNPITLREMAQTLGYEYHYLSRLFHQLMGMSFAEYVNLFRHQRALLLLQENKSITDVAAESGYGSLRAFHLNFSRLQGCSPSEYRKKKLF